MRKPTQAPISAEEAAQRAEPYAQQQALIALLERAHAHNRAVLERYGYPCPRGDPASTQRGYLGALRTSASIAEPEAQAAAAVIDAVGKVYRALFGADHCALANAALWLGLMITAEGEARARQSAIERSTQAKRTRADAHWTFRELFPVADAELSAERGRPPGWRRLFERAQRVAIREGYAAAAFDEITESRAKRYVKRRAG